MNRDYYNSVVVAVECIMPGVNIMDNFGVRYPKENVRFRDIKNA